MRGIDHVGARARILAIALGLACAILIALVYKGWISSRDLRDLDSVRARGVSPDGSAALVTGFRPGVLPWGTSALLDLANGRTIGLPSGSSLAEAAVSRNGVFWLQPVSPDGRKQQLHRVRFGGGPTALRFSFTEAEWIAASPSGRRLAVSTRAGTEVLDLEQGTIARVPASIDGPLWTWPVFESEHILRLYERVADQWFIWRLDLTSGAATLGGRLEARFLRLTSDLSSVIARGVGEKMFVADALTGRREIEFAAGTLSVTDLAGGGYAAVRRADGALQLDLVSRGGEVVRSTALRSSGRAILGAELRKRVVIVGIIDGARREVWIVDLTSGRTLRKLERTRPLLWSARDRIAPPPQSPAATAVTAEDGIFRIDPDTLELIPLIRTKPGRGVR